MIDRELTCGCLLVVAEFTGCIAVGMFFGAKWGVVAFIAACIIEAACVLKGGRE